MDCWGVGGSETYSKTSLWTMNAIAIHQQLEILSICLPGGDVLLVTQVISCFQVTSKVLKAVGGRPEARWQSSTCHAAPLIQIIHFIRPLMSRRWCFDELYRPKYFLPLHVFDEKAGVSRRSASICPSISPPVGRGCSSGEQSE